MQFLEQSELIPLIKRAQTGDENAYQQLYLDTYKSVFYLALRMVKNTVDAEDITQEVFITVHEKISELREPAAFYKWVNQITANKCAAFLRKYRGISKLDDEDEILKIVEDNPLNLPDKAIDDEATRKIILDVIDALPDGQRVCVMYYYYQQYTIAQIADLLELNENTVKSRLALARGKIRAALKEKEKKEGIKLYGIPLLLPRFCVRPCWSFWPPKGPPSGCGTISHRRRQVPRRQRHPLAAPLDNVQKPNIPSSTAAAAAEAAKAGIPIATKIIIGVLAAAVIATGAMVLPRFIGDFTPTITSGTETTQTENASPELDGGSYEADILNGTRHGWGVWTYRNYRYEGWWENGLPNGEGTLYKIHNLPVERDERYTYALDDNVSGFFTDGTITGEAPYEWNMEDGEVHQWMVLLEQGRVREVVYPCEVCGDELYLDSNQMIGGVPPWTPMK